MATTSSLLPASPPSSSSSSPLSFLTATPLPSPPSSLPPPPSLSWPDVFRALLGALIGLAAVLVAVLLWVVQILARFAVWAAARLHVVVAWPLTRLCSLARFLLSPIACTLAYVTAPFLAVARFLAQCRACFSCFPSPVSDPPPSLSPLSELLSPLFPTLLTSQPLYTFLGSAAFIGIVTGLAVKFVSSYAVLALRLRPEDKTALADETANSSGSSSSRSSAEYYGQSYAASLRLAAPGPSSVSEAEDHIRQWLDEFDPRQRKPSASHHKPLPFADDGDGDGTATLDSAWQKHAVSSVQPPYRPSHLLSTTILEESSTE